MYIYPLSIREDITVRWVARGAALFAVVVTVLLGAVSSA